jgi:hypothetical protein
MTHAEPLYSLPRVLRTCRMETAVTTEQRADADLVEPYGAESKPLHQKVYRGMSLPMMPILEYNWVSAANTC